MFFTFVVIVILLLFIVYLYRLRLYPTLFGRAARYNTRKEFFGASNLFKVESSSVPIEKREFPIKDSFDINKDNLVEQNKDTFLKDQYIDLLQKYIGNKYKVFGDSIQSIFTGSNVTYFTINVYDINNFFVHKILVYIDNNNLTVKVKELGSDQETSEQLKPGLSSLAPNFYRILNKLHLMDPFLTSGNS